MATICKNCAAQIIFDPKTQKVVCHTCGSSWDPQTVDVHEEFPDLQDFNEENEDADEIYKHFMACLAAGRSLSTDPKPPPIVSTAEIRV